MTRTSRLLLRYSVVVGVCLVAVPFAARSPNSRAQPIAVKAGGGGSVKMIASNTTPTTRPTTAPATRPAMKLAVNDKPKPAPLRHPLSPTDKPQEPAPLASILGLTSSAPPAAAAPTATPIATSPSQRRLPVVARDWLPPANPLVAPRTLPSDGHHVLAVPRSSDLPELAFESAPNLPDEIRLPAGSLVSAPSIDTTTLFARGPMTEPDPRAPADADPTATLSSASAITAVPPLRQTPAAFLTLAIPQPEETFGVSAANAQVPDADAPVMFWDFPARPPLPVAPK